ncbi:ABC transporter permease [Aggregatilinea lenta]|uniref:ABC transporter permease n=1 Tax=Aggregatilinea lenta TaxID=913108 RepID=UPI0013C34E2E|nr:ABC transporter permease [Aggregatilinea lenta]
MSSTAVTLSQGPQKARPEWRLIWRQFRRHKLAVISAVLLILLALVAIFADQIIPYDPNAIDAAYARGRPQPPTADHIFGTDNYGRDYFSRAVIGLRISLFVAVSAVVFQIAVGVVIGAVAGYFGGWIDNALMRFTDIFLSIPSFFLLLIVSGIFGGTIFTLIMLIGLLSWMTVARLLRAEILSLKERDFVLAAQCIGVSGRRLVLHHLLPNALAPIIVSATLAVPYAILTESSLSFLGRGVPPPHASLGKMMEDAQQWLRTAWWMWVVPGSIISMIVLTFNFVGDGLRDAFDPRLRR